MVNKLESFQSGNVLGLKKKKVAVVLDLTNKYGFPLSIYLSKYLFAALMPLMVLTI